MARLLILLFAFCAGWWTLMSSPQASTRWSARIAFMLITATLGVLVGKVMLFAAHFDTGLGVLVAYLFGIGIGIVFCWAIQRF